MYHTSVIEIDKTAYQGNLKFIQRLIGKKTKVSSVVKGNAYGHGIEYFVPMAQDCGQNHFSVFSAQEAREVFKVMNGEGTVLIMGMIENGQIEWAVKNGIEFYVFDEERLRNAVKASKRLKKRAVIHVEVETGLNRTGFDREQLKKVIEVLKENWEYVEFKGFCTHYAGAESISNYLRITHQQNAFKRFSKYIEESGLKPEIYHSACSAAAVRYPATRMDMARIGIMQYGYWSNMETYISYITKREGRANPLKRIISWKSKIMSVKTVKAGEFKGYGTSFLASKDMKIATVPVGYSHGFSRSLSNHGRVLINGERVSVIGTVSMNSFTIDITDVPHTKPGDEVVMIGDQGDLSISVSSFSEMSNQLNYELLTRLPRSIPRVIV